MIKPKKTRKIHENSKKNPKIFPKNLKFLRKIPKNPKNLPARFAGRLGFCGEFQGFNWFDHNWEMDWGIEEIKA